MSYVEGIARTGYAAKGVVYGIVGAIAASAAFGGGQATGSTGALQSLTDSSLGRIALGAIAVGLAGYVLWRAIQAIRDPEDDGAGKRAFYGISGLIYAGLAVQAARMALTGGSAGGGSTSTDQRTAELMQQPFGPWLVGIVGLAIGGYGIYQLVKAWQADLSDRLMLGRMSSTTRRWAVRAARAGMGARGIVFCIVGALFVIAALRSNPRQAAGLGGALRTLQNQPYGPWLLGIVAIGLVGYGVYQLVEARYRRIGQPSTPSLARGAHRPNPA